MVPFDSFIAPFAAVLGLSLVVERLLEYGKNIFEGLLGTTEGAQTPDLRRTQALMEETASARKRDRLARHDEDEGEKLRGEIESESDPETKREKIDAAMDLAQMAKLEWAERPQEGVVLWEPAHDLTDAKTVPTLILQLLGLVVGVVLARTSGLALLSHFPGISVPRGWDFLLTGLLPGGGSAPIHAIIRFITQRKSVGIVSGDQTREEKNAVANTGSVPLPMADGPATTTAVIDTASFEWTDIRYNGGRDREALESIHHRPGEPNLIVYHHTAMHSDSTFEDVVRVIKDRDWVTAYHCVITADGGIHPFCRWDRFGSHAYGYNYRSLGISFNGNFETDPEVPWSNPTGRFGLTAPTQQQVQAGARIVALWTLIYGIEPDFRSSVIPHKQISTTGKTCPGSNFPYFEFQASVEGYRDAWMASSSAMERIEQFKKRPYLYAGVTV